MVKASKSTEKPPATPATKAPKATKAPAPPPAVEAKLRAFFEKRALLAEADEKRTADVLAAIKVHQ